tara:strand:- start:3657 stop:4781 length:1125 start_codon:yes stop_codon:yes gene_type:complete
MKAVQVTRTEEKALTSFAKLPASIKRSIISPINKARLTKVMKLGTPTVLVLYTNDACNLKCKHCFYWKEVDSPANHHSIEQIEKLSKSLKHPLDLLILTGGEPFVRRDIDEIVGHFVKNNRTKRIHIATNGFMSKQAYKKVKEMLTVAGDCRITLQFSIDGFEEIHDRLRGRKNSFKNVCESVRLVNSIDDKRLAVSVATVVFQQNYPQIKELKKFVNEELGVAFKVNVLRKTDSVKGIPKSHLAEMDIRDSDYEVPTQEMLESLPDLIDDGTISSRIERQKIEHSKRILKGEKTLNCLAGIRDAVIFSNGEVALCEPTTAFASLKDFDYDFHKLWQSEAAKEKKKAFLGKCFCLQSCNLLNAMKFDTETLVNL